MLGGCNVLPGDVQSWTEKTIGVMPTTGAPTFGGRENDFGICAGGRAPFDRAMVPTAWAYTCPGWPERAWHANPCDPSSVSLIEKHRPSRPAQAAAKVSEWP
eukprot:2837672-Pyramimonas_sp.AAC.1